MPALRSARPWNRLGLGPGRHLKLGMRPFSSQEPAPNGFPSLRRRLTAPETGMTARAIALAARCPQSETSIRPLRFLGCPGSRVPFHPLAGHSGRVTLGESLPRARQMFSSALTRCIACGVLGRRRGAQGGRRGSVLLLQELRASEWTWTCNQQSSRLCLFWFGLGVVGCRLRQRLAAGVSWRERLAWEPVK